VYWCAAVEERLLAPDPAAGLSELHAANVEQLADLTRLVRGDLSALSRRSLGALITIDVHARGGFPDRTDGWFGCRLGGCRRASVPPPRFCPSLPATDVVGQLAERGVSSVGAFDWSMQLRYYWEGDDLVVRQVRQQTRSR
jgi:dynein heavy chain